jgi:hypothetical protein
MSAWLEFLARWAGANITRDIEATHEPPFGAAHGSRDMIVNATHNNQSATQEVC